MTNKLQIAAVAATLAISGLFYKEGMPLVEYQATCSKLQAAHTLLIGSVDSRMAFIDAESYRTPEQAAFNKKHGSGIANSLHTLRLAHDKILTINGKVTWKSEDYLQAGVLWEELGKQYNVPTAWGGRFKSVDAVHFSCPYKGIK